MKCHKYFISPNDKLPEKDLEKILTLQYNGKQYRTQITYVNTDIYRDGTAHRCFQDIYRDGFRIIGWMPIDDKEEYD